MRKNKPLLISLLCGVIYCAFLSIRYYDGIAKADTIVEAVNAEGMAILIAPHLILMILGVVFNALGYLQNHVEFALISFLLYVVSAILFLLYAPLVLVEIISSFIGYRMLDNQERKAV